MFPFSVCEGYSINIRDSCVSTMKKCSLLYKFKMCVSSFGFAVKAGIKIRYPNFLSPLPKMDLGSQNLGLLFKMLLGGGAGPYWFPCLRHFFHAITPEQ